MPSLAKDLIEDGAENAKVGIGKEAQHEERISNSEEDQCESSQGQRTPPPISTG